MNEYLSDMADRTIVVRREDGTPLFSIKALHAALLAGVAIMSAPRLAAGLALGALFKGVSLDVAAAPGDS